MESPLDPWFWNPNQQFALADGVVKFTVKGPNNRKYVTVETA